jgi:uncharacterized protein YndB with AHSA1/START domain
MKALWITGGSIMGLFALVVLIGYSLPVKHRTIAAATVKASPQALFALITNVEGLSQWRSDVKSVEILPFTDGRMRFRELSGNGAITYVIESFESNHRVVTRIDDKSLPFGGTWTYELEPAAGGRTTLRITEDGEIYNPIFRFVSRFVLSYDATMKRYLADVERVFAGPS